MHSPAPRNSRILLRMLRRNAREPGHAVVKKSDAHGGRGLVPDNIITLQAAREGNVYLASRIRRSTDDRAGDAPRARRHHNVPILTSYLVARRRCHGDDAAWDAQHAWGAERARRMVRDLGGFYTGRPTAAAGAQMMPPAWCSALAETMTRGRPFVLSLSGASSSAILVYGSTMFLMNGTMHRWRRRRSRKFIRLRVNGTRWRSRSG